MIVYSVSQSKKQLRIYLFKSCRRFVYMIYVFKYYHLQTMQQQDYQDYTDQALSQNDQQLDYHCYQDYEYYEYEQVRELQTPDPPYSIHELCQLINKIYEENEEKCAVTSLPAAWNIMLYSFCDFSNDKLLNMIDHHQIGRTFVLRYDPTYLPSTHQQHCPVCLAHTTLLSNPCGHAFCLDCWKAHIHLHHTDRNLYQLFPNCQWQGCFHKTNFLLMQQLWQQFPQIRVNFQKLLCLKYTQKSSKAILCSSQNCNQAIIINYPTSAVVECQCSTKICRFCKQSEHSPLACGDVKAWTNILESKQNLWMNEIITQKCPMCRTPIDKNGGCVHMTCICSYEFCWICLQIWKGHSSFYACSELTREAHEERLREEQEKRKLNEGEYSIRFEQSKTEIQRQNRIIKRLKELDLPLLEQKIKNFYNLHSEVVSDLFRFKQIRAYLIESLSFELNSEIYIFFQLPAFRRLKQQLLSFSKKHSQLDDYLSSKFKVLESPLVDSTKRPHLNNADVEGMIAAIKLELIQGRDHYNEMFKTLKKQYQAIRRCSFLQHCGI